MMAGLDGIQNKIHPGEPLDKNLYDLPPGEEKSAHSVLCPGSGLKRARQEPRVLNTGGVFTDDTIDAYIELKIGEVNRLRMITHPIEFGMYYSMRGCFSRT